MKLIKSKLNRVRGFTLLELVIVIAIIGILAVIVLPNMIQALGKARDAKKMTEIRGLQTFLTTRGIDTGLRYPSSQATLLVDYTNSKTRAPSALTANPADNEYHYVGINCEAASYPSVIIGGSNTTCAGYQIWVELEQKNPALDLDTDVTDSICSNYGNSSDTCAAPSSGATTGSVLLHTSAKEVCTSNSPTAEDCVFDLAP